MEIIKFVDKKIEGVFDRDGLKTLESISKHEHVVKPVVALPDFHKKAKMEAPSSIAIGVKGHIVPQFTSCSLNCGMGAITTDLLDNEKFRKNISEFYNIFRSEKKNKKYEINREELDAILPEGITPLLEKYDIDKKIVDSFERRGNMHDEGVDVGEISKLVPHNLTNHHKYNGLTNLGVGFGGNHFLEIQKISEIYDKSICRKNNITKEGQIVIMYHGGGGIIPGFIGGFFAKRRKGYKHDARLIYNKIKYHLKFQQGLASLLNIYKYYLRSKEFLSIPENSVEGKRVILANNAAMNYGFAYRLFMFIRVRDALENIFGKGQTGINLFKDISHNSIQREQIAGEKVWMHRHNSCRVQKDTLTLLPGFNSTSSYLGVGLDNTSYSLNSTPHGAGASVKAYRESGFLSEIDDRKTMIYRGESGGFEEVNHFTDEGVDAVISTLENAGVMKAIAKLTPIATLKDFT